MTEQDKDNTIAPLLGALMCIRDNKNNSGAITVAQVALAINIDAIEYLKDKESN